MSKVLKKLHSSKDPLENDLAAVYDHWQGRRREQGLVASLGYEPRDINSDGAVSVISSRVLKASSGFEEVDPNLSYEALVIKHSDRFTIDVIKAARNRINLGDKLKKDFQRQDIQFLIKAYPSEFFDNNVDYQDANTWIGKVVNIPMLVKADNYADIFLSPGSRSFIWFNEFDKNGERGRGLTAAVQFGPVSVDRKSKILDAYLFDRAIGKELLEAKKEQNKFISELNSYRHKRTWPINNDDVSLLLNSVRTKIHQIDSYERQDPDPNDQLNLEGIEEFTALRQVITRRNQSAFRKSLLSMRKKQCAISGTDEVSVLEAAHIIPYAERFADRDKLENGLLLRRDIHKLFDNHLISVNPETRDIVVSNKIKSSEYRKLNLKKLEDAVSKISLEFHFHKFKSQ